MLVANHVKSLDGFGCNSVAARSGSWPEAFSPNRPGVGARLKHPPFSVGPANSMLGEAAGLQRFLAGCDLEIRTDSRGKTPQEAVVVALPETGFGSGFETIGQVSFSSGGTVSGFSRCRLCSTPGTEATKSRLPAHAHGKLVVLAPLGPNAARPLRKLPSRNRWGSRRWWHFA